MRLFCVLALFALLNYPTPSKQQQKQASEQDSVTPPSPVSVPVTVTFNQTPTPEETKRPEQKSTDYIADAISAGLIIVALLGVKVANDSLKEVKRQADSTEKAANAARDNALAVINAERALILPELERLGGITVNSVERGSETFSIFANIICGNHGRTIAWITEVRAGVIVTDEPLASSPPLAKADIVDAGVFPVLRNGNRTINHADFKHEGRIESYYGRLIILFGSVSYRDIYQKERTSTFGYRLNADRSRLIRLVNYPKWNEST